MKKTTSQTGSAHLVVIIIIVLVVIGALGYVLWNNFLKQKTSTPNITQTSQNKVATPPAKKSEIIVLQNSDMNKYVNYEQGFEFEFPKAIYSGVSCTTSTTMNNNYGQQIPAEAHYNASEGSVDTTVLESSDRYIIAPRNMVVLSNYTQTSDGHSLAHACDVKPVTTALVDMHNEVNGATYVDNTAVKEFNVITAKNDDDITAFIRKVTGDNQATIGSKGQLANGRQDISIKYGPDVMTGFGAYKLWYYPTNQKLIYFALGQGAVLVDPVNRSNDYDMNVANSFRFATN